MGMYDEVEFDPEWTGLPSACRHFQTKCLDSCMDRYVVTKAGRLCLVGNVWGDDEPATAEESVDIDFHGDMRLVPTEGDDRQDFTARFTHGTLEWVRPVDIARRVALAAAMTKLRGGGEDAE